MENKKWYYRFEATKETKNDDGTSTKEVFKFALLKPNRRLREDGELFYASETSRYAKAGVLPKAAWNTILSNGGGTISEDDREHYGKVLNDFREKSFKIQTLLLKTSGDRTTEENEQLDALTVELEEARREIQAFESSQINIFDNTAESKARNRAILWWVTTLVYRENNGKFTPFFDGKTFDDKLDQYDDLEQEGEHEFELAVLRRATYLITLWFLGRATSEEDFKNFDENLVKGAIENDLEEEKASEETSVDAPVEATAEAPSE